MKKRKPSEAPGGDPKQRTLTDILSSAVERIDASIAQAKRVEAVGAGWSSALSSWNTIKEQLEVIAGLSDQIAEFGTELRERAEKEFLEIESGLRAELENLKFRIDGNWPKLFIERAVSLEFFDSSRTAVVGGVKVDDPSVPKIISLVRPMVQELLPKSFSSAGFLAKLREAYDSTKSSSKQVPILDLYRSFVVLSQKPRFWRDAREGSFTGISIEQFRARLSKSLEEIANGGGTASLDIRLLPPLDPKDALFLYLPGEARFGYVGRVEFSSDNIAN